MMSGTDLDYLFRVGLYTFVLAVFALIAKTYLDGLLKGKGYKLERVTRGEIQEWFARHEKECAATRFVNVEIHIKQLDEKMDELKAMFNSMQLNMEQLRKELLKVTVAIARVEGRDNRRYGINGEGEDGGENNGK